MANERKNFIEGCARTNQIPEKKANAIFDLLEKFAGYGFNKSHSAAYGVVSYQTAYLKAHYPVEFMAGLLSNEINNTEKISVFVAECKRMGIAILPPDVNKSSLKFTPETSSVAGGVDPGRSAPEQKNAAGVSAPGYSQNAIRYGLAAIKNVGEGAMESAIAERERGGEFKSLEDFCGRLGTRVANKKMIESLIKAGAFDFLGRQRAELFACIDEALGAAAAAHRDRTAGQVSLFDEVSAPALTSRPRNVQPWTEHEKLSYEKELLGFYVSGHPLDAYAAVFAANKYPSLAALKEMADRTPVKVAGAIVQLEKKFTKKEGKPFAVTWMEDLTGTIEVVIWNDVYSQVSEILATGRVVEVRGTVDSRGDLPRVTAQRVRLLSTVRPNGNAVREEPTGFDEPAVLLQFSPSTTRDELRQVRELLASSPGVRPVQLLFERVGGAALRVDAGSDCRINLTGDLQQKLSRWLVANKAQLREATTEA
jgi:DNA polymerase-3 subunit alpha